MSLYVLDTDHVTLLHYGHADVVAHLESTPEEERAITIVSVEEQLRAWFTQVRKAHDAAQLARAYNGLSQRPYLGFASGNFLTSSASSL